MWFNQFHICKSKSTKTQPARNIRCSNKCKFRCEGISLALWADHGFIDCMPWIQNQLNVFDELIAASMQSVSCFSPFSTTIDNQSKEETEQCGKIGEYICEKVVKRLVAVVKQGRFCVY